MIRSGDGGATAGGGAAAAAPRGRRQRRPGGRGGSGSGASPWWMPHPERCPPSREPQPPPQGGGGNSLRRGDPSPLPSLQRPAKGSEAAGKGGWQGKKEGGLRRRTGELLLWPLGWSEAGSGQEGAGGRAENPGAEAALPSGMRRGGSRGPLGGGGRGVAEPRLRAAAAAAARSCRRPPHHLPLSPRQRMGRSSGTSRTRRGASGRRIPPDTPAGTTPQGGDGGGGECVRQATRSPRPGQAKSGRVRGAGSQETACERGERLQAARQPVPTASSAGQLLTSSRPPEGSREGGGGSAHAARSFRRRRCCPNRGRPREKEAK